MYRISTDGVSKPSCIDNNTCHALTSILTLNYIYCQHLSSLPLSLPPLTLSTYVYYYPYLYPLYICDLSLILLIFLPLSSYDLPLLPLPCPFPDWPILQKLTCGVIGRVHEGVDALALRFDLSGEALDKAEGTRTGVPHTRPIRGFEAVGRLSPDADQGVGTRGDSEAEVVHLRQFHRIVKQRL